MERKGIIKLLRISLLIHMLYLIRLIFLFFHQGQIQAVYMPADIERKQVLGAYIIIYDVVVFILHTALTIVLDKKLSGGGVSISEEVKGAILFGGGIFCLDGAVYYVVMKYVASFHGDLALACYGLFRRETARVSPIRMIAITVLLAALGMSIYCKLMCREKAIQR